MAIKGEKTIADRIGDKLHLKYDNQTREVEII